MLYFSNTISGKKELFSAPNNTVKMYVCGITPYSSSHIGHARVYIAFDVLYRLLQAHGYEINYCRNVTDIDDKLLDRAQKELGDRNEYHQLAEKYFALFEKNMAQLNCLTPTHQPKATETIPQMIAFIQKLIEQGSAYVSESDVYFNVASFANYGSLSGQKIAQVNSGARIAISDIKKDPRDFVLWKGESGTNFWQSPWGNGRPGWHIECSAMAHAYLGEHIDIHGGGLDLVFPHHENEVAQSESLFGAPFARFWMHNGLITVDNEKMSKSLGNIVLLDELLQDQDPMVIRFYFLTHHYKHPAEFCKDRLISAGKNYERIINILADAKKSEWNIEQLQSTPIAQEMFDFLCDDMNTPGFFGTFFANQSEISQNADEKTAIAWIIKNILGLNLEPVIKKEVLLTPEIAILIEQRNQARASKEWQKADALREQLRQLGFDVQDTKL